MPQRGGPDLTVPELLERNMELGRWLGAAKRIINRGIPNLDSVTADDLIRAELSSEPSGDSRND